MEADEAGRLRAFREKFGRGWDAERMDLEDRDGGGEGKEKEASLMDLITGFAKDEKEGSEASKNREIRDKLEKEQQEEWEKKAAENPVKARGGSKHPGRK